MKTAILNIGLSIEVSPGNNIEYPRQLNLTLQLLHTHFRVLDLRIVDSQCEEGRERTVVAHVEFSPIMIRDSTYFPSVIYGMAQALDQKCIAVRFPGRKGQLIGPEPYESGFNPEFFHTFG
jgi:hypothetical protein